MKRVYSYLLLLALGVVLLMAAGCSSNSENAPAGDMSTDTIQEDVGSTAETPAADGSDAAGSDTAGDTSDSADASS
ncbi:hypothetical protein COLU111180_02120 [Cohnella lubricantis]|uniref:Uncharacterized protein n=1 Tax=Cohnella lubricantis TaxID=2163172 RepID=A0A841TJB2_9BACL|nr:hypothetical protein [Cohnella lubricantis]MBB6679017.1 hypothetical protein [Cohnella lubricantis]MBP2119494.1 hypothetical protein [Cohnella lubricantis]